MKSSLRIEEFCMLLLGTFLFSKLSIDWWWFLILFLTPDIGMLGYLKDSKLGAITYNLLHHKGIAIILYLTGIILKNEILQFIGLLIFSHASFDRMLGYGLKFKDNFNNTHLGKIGKYE